MTAPFYLIVPAGPRREAHRAALKGNAEVFSSFSELGKLDEREPGFILLDRDAVDAGSLLELADRVAEAELGWVLAVIGPGEEAEVRTLCFGVPAALEAVSLIQSEPENAKGVLMEFRKIVAEVAKVRHDLNNPLTAALAEAQLLLFDIEDEEARESLEIIQEQLRRLRDLIASTNHIRLPRE